MPEATPPIAGTYHLRVCRVRCSTPDAPNVLGVGRLVLAERPIDTAMHIRSDSARRLLSFQFAWEADAGPPNGCFVWDQKRDHPPSYAVSRVAGLLSWSVTGDSVRFRLYRSPDAAHSVTAVRTPEGFQGRGISSGAGVAAVDWPEDVVVAERTGAPDFSVCNDAGERELADYRDYARERQGVSKRLQN